MSTETIDRTLLDTLDPRAAAAVEHCDVKRIHPAVLKLLNAESISTRMELAIAMQKAPNGNATLAGAMMLDGMR